MFFDTVAHCRILFAIRLLKYDFQARVVQADENLVNTEKLEWQNEYIFSQWL